MIRVLLFLLLFTACSTKPEVPKELLQPPVMKDIMYDLIRVDGVIANTPHDDSTGKRVDSRLKKYQQVFALHGTNRDQFMRSLKYYEANPPILKIVLDSLQAKSSVPLPNYARDTVQRRPLPL